MKPGIFHVDKELSRPRKSRTSDYAVLGIILLLALIILGAYAVDMVHIFNKAPAPVVDTRHYTIKVCRFELDKDVCAEYKNADNLLYGPLYIIFKVSGKEYGFGGNGYDWTIAEE